MDFNDYYKTLGVEKTASADVIKRTYRKLAKKYHPDTNAGSDTGGEKFKEVNEAYEVLGDPDKRAKYDEIYDDMKSGRYQTNSAGGFDPSVYGNYNGPNSGGGYQYAWSSDGGDASDFSDFFNTIFGGGGSRTYHDIFGSRSTGGFENYSENGQDISAKVEIGIKQAFKGGQQTVNLQTETGNKTIKFKIPAGIQSGEKIKLSGLGGAPFGKGKPGDLYLEIDLKSEAGFSLEGPDLVKNIEIFPWQAALGDEILVNTLDEKLNVKIPANIQTGGKLRISARGYPTKNGKRGSLSLVVKVVNPTQISGEMKKLYEQMAELSKKSGVRHTV